jgi:hypothetical protein
MECIVNGKPAIQEVLLTDHTTPPVELYFIQGLGATTLATGTSIDDTTLDLTDATGFVDGDYIGVFEPATSRFYFGEQIGAPAANVISLDTPLDFAFKAGDNVIRTTRNLAVDGSVDTQIFAVRGAGDPDSKLQIDITRIILTMEGPNTGGSLVPFDTSTFGNIVGGLTKGLVFREVNGRTTNLWNAKTNGELAGICYDVRIDGGARAGTDGLAMRKTYAGQDKSGTALRIRAGDSIQILVQDDLTDLDFIRVVAEGHVTD